MQRRTFIGGALAALAAPVGVAIAKVLPKRNPVRDARDVVVSSGPLGGFLLSDKAAQELEELERQWYMVDCTVTQGKVTGDGQFLNMRLLDGNDWNGRLT